MGTKKKSKPKKVTEPPIDKVFMMRLPLTTMNKSEEECIQAFLDRVNDDLLAGVRVRSIVPLAGGGDWGWYAIHIETTLAIETALALKKK